MKMHELKNEFPSVSYAKQQDSIIFDGNKLAVRYNIDLTSKSGKKVQYQVSANLTIENGKIAKIVEIMNQTNPILEDLMWVEGNLPTGHKTTIRSGLPSAAWRLLNYGIQPSKSRTVQVTDSCGMLEAYAEVDKDLANLNGNTPEFRLSEDKSFIEAMNQEFASTLFYGNTATDPEKFLGLAPRFNAKSGAENGENVILGGGTESANTSIWLIGWGDATCHGIFPKGKMSGLQMNDLGEVTLEDAAGGKYQGFRSHYKWDCGFVLRDWRYVVRIANIDVGDLTKAAATGADLVDLMVQALEVVPNLTMGRFAFYANKTITSYLRRQITNKSNVHLNLDEVAGKRVLTFDGVPVRKCDALVSTEATIA
jgi:hypothetical protein